jgi:hypothetical protein
MAGDCAVFDFGEPFADQHFGSDVRPGFCFDLARGTRSARPVRKHATSSRFSAPRLWTYSAW